MQFCHLSRWTLLMDIETHSVNIKKVWVFFKVVIEVIILMLKQDLYLNCWNQYYFNIHFIIPSLNCKFFYKIYSPFACIYMTGHFYNSQTDIYLIDLSSIMNSKFKYLYWLFGVFFVSWLLLVWVCFFVLFLLFVLVCVFHIVRNWWMYLIWNFSLLNHFWCIRGQVCSIVHLQT